MQSRRRLFLEPLEARYALNADVDGSGLVAPLDILLIVNHLHHPSEFAASEAYDVNSDGVISLADCEAVIAELGRELDVGGNDSDTVADLLSDDVGDGSAGGGSTANEMLAEGEGSGSGSGGGSEWHVWISGSAVSLQEEGEWTMSFTVSRDGPTTEALTVGLDAFQIHSVEGPWTEVTTFDDFQLRVNGQPIGLSVTIPAGASTVVVVVMAVDDSTIEEYEEFVIELEAPAAPYISSGGYMLFDIVDDEWRFINAIASPTGTEDPDSFVWQPDSIPIVRPGLQINGTLYPKGYVEVEDDGVQIKAEARADFIGTYYANTGWGSLDFTCNSQTGDIQKTGNNTSFTDNQEWVSAAFKYEYEITEGVNPVLNFVEIVIGLGGASGGAFVADQPTQAENSGSATYEYTIQQEWQENAQTGFGVLLRCHKGPDPEEE